MKTPVTLRLVSDDEDTGQKTFSLPVSIVTEDGTSIKAYIDKHAGGGLGPTITVASNEEIDRLFANQPTNTTKEEANGR